MTHFTLEQISDFLAVVDRGSFSAAAQARRKAQPAMTYSIQKLEFQLGATLFDRSDYRPKLTEGGKLLLAQARRIVEAVGEFDLQARGVAAGVEQELAIAVDPAYPTPLLIEAMTQFQQLFPSVQTKLYTEVLDSVTNALVDGTCSIGILSVYSNLPPSLNRLPMVNVELLMVASPEHPLGRAQGTIAADALRDHVQLTLMDRSGVAGVRDYGIMSGRPWRLGDRLAMLAMLRAGLGFGIVADHLVRADLESGRLVRLHPQIWGDSGSIPLPLYAAWRADLPLGPAAQWLLDLLSRRGER